MSLPDSMFSPCGVMAGVEVDHWLYQYVIFCGGRRVAGGVHRDRWRAEAAVAFELSIRPPGVAVMWPVAMRAATYLDEQFRRVLVGAYDQGTDWVVWEVFERAEDPPEEPEDKRDRYVETAMVPDDRS